MAVLRKTGYVQVSFDGGKTSYCEDGTKMISVCGNLPSGGSVYMGTINTHNEPLNAERCGQSQARGALALAGSRPPVQPPNPSPQTPAPKPQPPAAQPKPPAQTPSPTPSLNLHLPITLNSGTPPC